MISPSGFRTAESLQLEVSGIKLRDPLLSYKSAPKAKIRFIEPMYAMLVNELPEGSDWFYEVKLDGYRCLAGRDAAKVTLWSRRQNLFTDQFPQIARACERIPKDTLLDGEIVALDEKGRVSFNLLQHHRSQAQALRFYAFDILIYGGRSLLKLPLESRREALKEVFKDIDRAGPIALSETMNARPAELVRLGGARIASGVRSLLLLFCCVEQLPGSFI
jgi:ATP-dependent DNA ligase